MIEQALWNHLRAQEELLPFLATYADGPAVFMQEAPADNDKKWAPGPQYGRIVFTVDIKGDPARTAGGTLMVDILCQKGQDTPGYPEDIEPIIRKLIHGWFFSSGTFAVAAQWDSSDPFTEPKNKVTGCTVSFALLAFPVLTTSGLDVVARLNEWTSQIEGLYVINYDELPADAWKPGPGESAVYWRRLRDGPSPMIRDRYAMIGRMATIKGHIFAEDIAAASAVANDLIIRLYTAKRLLKPPESPIMVDDRNTQDDGADPLRTGQLTVEATYCIMRYAKTDNVIRDIKKTERKEPS